MYGILIGGVRNRLEEGWFSHGVSFRSRRGHSGIIVGGFYGADGVEDSAATGCGGGTRGHDAYGNYKYNVYGGFRLDLPRLYDGP